MVALLLVMAGLLVLGSLHKKLAYDEYDNLAYGYRVLTHGPVLPPNGQRMPILVLNALGCPHGCLQADVEATEGSLLLVRLPTMLFALGLALVVYAWAAEWMGPRAGLLALLLAAFQPTLLAHGKQVTTDVQVAFFTVGALWAAWRSLRNRGPVARNVAVSALMTAGALLSKYTSVLLVPILGLVLAIDLWKRRPVTQRTVRDAMGSALAFVLLVLFFLNGAYFFDGTFRRADSYPWRSARLQPLRSSPVPLPLPRVFVLGIDFSYFVQEQPDLGRGNNYVLGRLNTNGIWYAFPLMLLLKTPLALLPGCSFPTPWSPRSIACSWPPSSASATCSRHCRSSWSMRRGQRLATGPATCASQGPSPSGACCRPSPTTRITCPISTS